MKNNLVFLREFIRSFKTTGSAFPTSRWAAHAMVEPISSAPPDHSAKILEIGPGSGSVTVKILENMGFADRLSICEINERFMGVLRSNLANNPYFLTHKSRIDWHCCPMQDLPNEKYDIIVCALPFLNFDIPLIKEILEKIKNLSHENTVMTYYEYIGLRPLGKISPVGGHRARLHRIDQVIDDMLEKHLSSKKNVWLNVSPIHVYTLGNLNQLQVLIDEMDVAA